MGTWTTRLRSNESMTEHDAFVALQAENARLVALLESRGIEWRSISSPSSAAPVTASEAEPPRASLSTADKVALFRRLFRGRTDVYTVQWESKTSSKSGYAPACANEWRAGVCEKPCIKCGDCGHRLLIPPSATLIYEHRAWGHTVGVYPLLEDDTCHLFAVDIDEAEWREDACEITRATAARHLAYSGVRMRPHGRIRVASRSAAKTERRRPGAASHLFPVPCRGHFRLSRRARSIEGSYHRVRVAPHTPPVEHPCRRSRRAPVRAPGCR